MRLSILDLRARVVVGLCVGALVAAAMVWTESGPVGGWVYDPDDALRLVMVRDWLDGQAWGDVSQHRLAPGGTMMHWTRVDDLPVAAMIVALRGWFGEAAAERWAMIAWPVALVPPLMAVVAGAAGRSAVGLAAALATATSGALLFRFMPGRIDHHAVMTLSALLACCALLRPPTFRAGLAAGGATAVCLAVGFEDLAVLATLGGCVGLLWARCGARRLASGYGIGLGTGMIVTEVTFVPDGAHLETACDALSGGWVPAVALVALGLAVLAQWDVPRRVPHRVVTVTGLGAVGLALLLSTGGAKCLSGPYPGLSDTARSYWLLSVREMKDVVSTAGGDWKVLCANGLGVAMALSLACCAAARGWRPDPLRWCYLACLLVAAAFGFRYVRNSGLPVAMAGPVVALALAELRLPRRIGAVVTGVVLAASCVPATLLAREAWTDMDRWDRVGSRRLTCESRDAWAEVARFDPGLASVPVDLGPEALAYTPHSVLAAGIHRASHGIDEQYRLMKGSDSEALDVVMRDDLDYVVWCDDGFRLPKDAAPRPDLQGRILQGRLPGWLESVPYDGPVRIALVVKYKARKAWDAYHAPLPPAPAVSLPPRPAPFIALPHATAPQAQAAPRDLPCGAAACEDP